MKVLFVNPPWSNNGRYGVRAGSRWPFTVKARGEKSLEYIPFPFFLAYSAALARTVDGVTVSAIDAIAEGLTDQEYCQRVCNLKPDVVVAETSASSLADDLAYATKTKTLMPDAVYIITGPQTPESIRDILISNDAIDYATYGEYEWTIRELVQQLRGGTVVTPDKVRGLGYRRGNIMINERRELGNLLQLPWPAWDLFPMKNYKDYFCDLPKPMVNMLASRGCPFSCNFCLWPDVMYGGQNYRVRPPEDVVAEMEFLINHYGFRSVYFDDDTFNIGKERILAICREITRKRLDISWAVMARADTFDEKTIQKMRDAGLYAIKYGVESGSQEILDRTGKKLDLEAVRRNVLFTKSIGVKVHLTFTLGLLGETRQTLSQSIKFALELDPHSIQMSIATPFPGTRFYNEAMEKGLLTIDCSSHFDGSSRCVINTDELSSKDIEDALQDFEELWRRHKKTKKIQKTFSWIPLSWLKR